MTRSDHPGRRTLDPQAPPMRSGSKWLQALVAASLILGGTLALSPPVSAHGGAPFGTHPFFEDGVLIGGGTDYGMLLLEDGIPLWTCEEAFEFEPNWWYRAPGSPTLAGTYLGLRWSDDGGCSWQPTDGLLATANASAVAADPLDPLHVFVSTAGSGLDNRVFESTDGGQTFVETGLELESIRLRGLAVSAGGEQLWVLAIREADALPILTRSTDGGSSWSEPHYSLDGWGIAELRGLSEDESTLFLSAQAPGGGFHLLEVDADLASPPLASEQDFSGPLNVVTEHGGALFVVAAWTEHFLRPAGGTAFVERSPGPGYCILRHEGLLWGCGLDPNHPQFSWSSEGEDWEALIEFDQVVPRNCPKKTRAAQLCPPIWKIIGPQSGDDDDDSAGPGDDDDSADPPPNGDGPPGGGGTGSCSCTKTSENASDSIPLSLLPGLTILLLARRRSPHSRRV
ncbi:MAG: hypothetical protein VX498_08080 [Myxococcota bacterium]|nr:hypothetical protein [Myxococcota bacterium]